MKRAHTWPEDCPSTFQCPSHHSQHANTSRGSEKRGRWRRASRCLTNTVIHTLLNLQGVSSHESQLKNEAALDALLSKWCCSDSNRSLRKQATTGGTGRDNVVRDTPLPYPSMPSPERGKRCTAAPSQQGHTQTSRPHAIPTLGVWHRPQGRAGLKCLQWKAAASLCYYSY